MHCFEANSARGFGEASCGVCANAALENAGIKAAMKMDRLLICLCLYEIPSGPLLSTKVFSGTPAACIIIT